MAKYFNFFPISPYIKDNDSTDLDLLTNITARFGFEESFKENDSTFYEYEIRDGDTPEVIASKIYGDPEKHWVILSFNDITDAQYDWPLEQRTLVSFIDSKYTANGSANTTPQSGIVWSKINVKEYYKVLTTTHTASQTITINKYEIDANTYANVSPGTITQTLADGATITVQTSKETTTYYDYEIEDNEKKRNIKILKPEFVSAVDQEFRRVIVNGG